MRRPLGQVTMRLVVYAALLALLALTVGLSFLPLSPVRIAAHLAIALVSALMIVLVFMRLRASPHLVQVIAGGSVLWLVILFGFTFLDYTHR